MYINEFSGWNWQILDFMDDLVRVIDKNGFIIYTNTSMNNFAGKEEGKICKFKNREYPEKIDRKVYSSINCITTSGGKNEIISEFIKVEDKTFFVKSSPIFDIKKKYCGSIEVFRDVTKENELNKSLMEYRKKTKNDMIVASDIQKSLLMKLNKIEGIKLDYRYLALDELSGDFFDCIDLCQDRVCIYMADVMGHGISSSFITTFIKFTVRAITKNKNISHPRDILRLLAQEFSTLNIDMYFTIFLGIYNKKTREFVYSNAGHNCIPILMKNDENLLLELSGLPISWISNIFSQRGYSYGNINLSSGDTLLFYTDGLTETKNKEKNDYGEERLISIIEKYKNYVSNEELLDKIIESAKEFRDGQQADDITLLSMRVI